MRVLLMVQDPSKRVRCATPPRLLRIKVNGEWFLTKRETELQRASDRWWLVEAESAEAARRVIEYHKGWETRRRRVQDQFVGDLFFDLLGVEDLPG